MPARKSTRKQPGGQNNLLGAVIVACLLGIGYLISRGVIDLSQFGIDPEVVGLPTSTAAAPPVDSTGAIRAFFTTPSLVYPDVPKERRPPPYEQAIVADIDAATRSVDMATYEYNLTSISQALVRAQQRGVTVRLALDRENLDDPTMAKWAGVVQDANIPVHWEETDAFLHSKFIIIDKALVWTGSWNATINDTYRNNNNLLRITIPAIVQNYQVEFDQMADDKFGTKKAALTPNPLVRLGGERVENYFSPKDGVRQHVVSWVSKATTSIDFLAFSYTSDEIGDAMLDRLRAGVAVRGVYEKRNAQGIGSEFDRLKNAGVDVLVDGNCYTMHHKVIIIDGHIVITGSYNFTGRAEDVNDENLLIIDDPAIAQLYEQEFERVYSQAQSPTSCG